MRNLLHIPTAVCNIVGGPSTRDYDSLIFDHDGDDFSAKLSDSEGRRLGHFVDHRGLLVLRLSGYPVGRAVGATCLEPDKKYAVHALWPDAERCRWLATQPTPGADHTGLSTGKRKREGVDDED